MQGRNQSATDHDSLTGVIDALTAARTLGMRDVTVTTVAKDGVPADPAAYFVYHVEAIARSARDALEEQHNLFSRAASQ